jgi:hypothetical protein
MKKINLLIPVLALWCFNPVFSQNSTTKTENIVLITLDGLRWQELFKGADSLFIGDTGMVNSYKRLLA